MVYCYSLVVCSLFPSFKNINICDHIKILKFYITVLTYVLIRPLLSLYLPYHQFCQPGNTLRKLLLCVDRWREGRERRRNNIYIHTCIYESGTHVAPKDRLNMECVPSVKALDGRSQVSTPRVNKMFDAPPALPKTARKTLETVSRTTEKSVKTNGPLRQKQTTFFTKEIAEKTV